jgi:hypothetical protein
MLSSAVCNLSTATSLVPDSMHLSDNHSAFIGRVGTSEPPRAHAAHPTQLIQLIPYRPSQILLTIDRN